MGLNIAGGLRAANSFMQGQDEATARNRAEEDRTYQQGQRAYQAGQQARTVAEQQRADTLRSDLSNIKSETSTDLRDPNAPQVDDDGNPSAAALPAVKVDKLLPDQQLRQAAAAYSKAGDFANAIKHHQEADKIGWERSTKLFQEVNAAAAAPSVSALDVANQIAKIFSNDPFSGKVTNVRDAGNGGVTIDASNRETGAVSSKTFANKAELLESMHSYYSPASYAALQAKRQEALIKRNDKIAEEQAKGHVLSSGGQFVPGVGDPRKPVINDTGYINIGTAEAPNWVKPNSKGGKTDSPMKEVIEATKTILTDSSTKLEPAQTARVQTVAQQIFTEGRVDPATGRRVAIPAALAAQVALDVTLDPSKEEPSVDPKTGKTLTVYNHPQQGQFVISHAPPKDLKPEQMKLQVQKMLDWTGQQGPTGPALRSEMERAAFDPKVRASMFDKMDAEYDTQVQAQIASNPQQAPQLLAGAALVKQARRDSVTAKLGLIKQYSKAPALERQKTDLTQNGGIAAAANYRPKPGTPPELAQRASASAKELASQRAAESSRELEAMLANDAAKKKLAQEISWLTRDEIRVMSPSERGDLLRKYNGVLPTDLINALTYGVGNN
jgi:hypothetical protein